MIDWNPASFLEGPKAALKAARGFNDGHYTSPPQAGIRAFARVYSAWAYGQTVRKTPQFDLSPSTTVVIS